MMYTSTSQIKTGKKMDFNTMILLVVLVGAITLPLIFILYALLHKPKRAEREVVETPRFEVRARGEDIIDIEGIGPSYAEKLNTIGIKTTYDLLEAGATRKGREELAEKTGILPKLILEWVNLADLFRIKGIGEEYSDLLEEAGVDTIVELSRRNPENLHARIIEINEKKKLVRRTPTRNQVKEWVEQAKKMPRKVEH